MATMKDVSRQEWNGERTKEDINAGSLQRIADATEKMAQSYVALIEERERYKRWYENQRDLVQIERRSNSALRGVITKLKKDR